MLKQFLPACALALTVSSHAEQAYQAPLVTDSLLLDIAHNTVQSIIVGERGHILSSEDGIQWQQSSVPTVSTLTAVAMVDEHAWVVGHDAVILHKVAGDTQWQRQYFDPELEKPLLDVLFFDTQHGIAIGAYGTFFRTRDGGANWQSERHAEFLSEDDQAYLNDIRQESEDFYQQELSSILPHLNRVSRDGDRLWLAGEMGLLAYSDDQGSNWQRMELDYYGSFFDIRRTAAGVLAAGLRGTLFRLDEASEQWQRVPSGSQASLNSIVTDSALNEALVVGNNGTLVCVTPTAQEQVQLADNDAVVNATVFKGHLITVTAGGVQTLPLDANSSTCKKVREQL
ncbi:hypothetical protein LJ739_05415 [Aestuariibacter halophilus]|uniref:Photosynthesis system II assembly factor Ycf48/Hcf136-like domain-containing protein n=1 Tax=Fluctibacter halophilus TaxID=226011 RepID=A0ABS8G584_9ALTE|nr:YCF48-related protein [Aestuariibacter halophilus]MCC2615673.1 hypothetical protein [Aestuariibacter halophilus]